MDNYPYDITQVNIAYDGTLFIPISAINQLRRDLFEKLEDKVTNSYKRELNRIKLNKNYQSGDGSFSISLCTNNLEHLKNIKGVERVYLEIPPKDNGLILEEEQYNLNYMITFLKKAIMISKDNDYELIWKWPSITHDKLIHGLNRVKGILAKMNIEIPIMSNNFNADYAFYDINVCNSKALSSLENYKKVILSPEMSIKDFKDLIRNAECPEKAEIMVYGSVEVIKSRYQLLYNEKNKKYGNYLTDYKNNRYLVKKSISNEELVIFSEKELSLLDEVSNLRSIGYSNFMIDARFKGDDYIKIVDILKDTLTSNENEK